MNGDQIIFDDEAHWNLDEVFFWANLGKKRVRCVVNQRVILLLPGFDGARGDQMAARANEVKRLLEPFAISKINTSQLSKATYDQIDIDESDVVRLRAS